MFTAETRDTTNENGYHIDGVVRTPNPVDMVREKVLEFLNQTFGEHGACQIETFPGKCFDCFLDKKLLFFRFVKLSFLCLECLVDKYSLKKDYNKIINKRIFTVKKTFFLVFS